jgi:hypothetical protein
MSGFYPVLVTQNHALAPCYPVLFSIFMSLNLSLLLSRMSFALTLQLDFARLSLKAISRRPFKLISSMLGMVLGLQVALGKFSVDGYSTGLDQEEDSEHRAFTASRGCSPASCMDAWML